MFGWQRSEAVVGSVSSGQVVMSNDRQRAVLVEGEVRVEIANTKSDGVSIMLTWCACGTFHHHSHSSGYRALTSARGLIR